MKTSFKLSLVLIACISSLQAQGQTAAGKALIAKGKVTAATQAQPDSASANTANEQARRIKRRSLIYNDEVVSTGLKSKAQLRMTDGGMIALKENSELVISEYQFSDENGRGSVAMELLKGGLRSVTGAIKAERGDYNLKTPVGSIGIRGTHYEIEIVGGELFIAVWDGAVDLTVDTGAGPDTVSFGEGEDFSFGVISEGGEVTELLEAPDNFDEGHSSDTEQVDDSNEEADSEQPNNNGEQTDESTEEDLDDAGSSGEESDSSEQPASSPENEQSQDSDEEQAPEDLSEINVGNSEPDNEPEIAEIETPEQTEVDVDVEVVDEVTANLENFEEDASFLATDDFSNLATVPTEQLIAEREGSFTYGGLEETVAESSSGEVRNFDMGMEIDFENGTVPEGTMSFEDDDGEWFVTFGGVISTANIDLDVSFASHGDNLADGEVHATFFDGLESIIGEFELHEIENPDVRVIGSYRIK